MNSTLGQISNQKKKGCCCCQWLAYESFSLNLPSHSPPWSRDEYPGGISFGNWMKSDGTFAFLQPKRTSFWKGVGTGSLYRERLKTKGKFRIGFLSDIFRGNNQTTSVEYKNWKRRDRRWKASENPSENAAAEKRSKGRVRHIGGWTFVFVFYCLVLGEKWKKRRKAFYPFGFSRFLVWACVCCTGVFTCLGDNFPFVGENLSRLDSNPFAEVPYSGMCMQFVLLVGVFSRLAVKQFAPAA